MNEVIEAGIREWLVKYNYLFSKQEIQDLVETIGRQWVGFASVPSFDQGEDENCKGCVFKEFHEQNYPQEGE